MEIEETEVKIRKVLKEFKIENKEELEWKLRLLMLKIKCFEDVDDHEEKQKSIKIIRKYTEEIDAFEEKITSIKELIIETINYNSNEPISDLNFKGKLTVRKSKDIEIKVTEINVSERITDVIKGFQI